MASDILTCGLVVERDPHREPTSTTICGSFSVTSAFDPKPIVDLATTLASMKRHIAILLASLVSVIGACARNGTNQRLRSELLEMGRADQQLHRRGYELMEGLPGTQAKFVAFIGEEKRTDAARFARLKGIVTKYGWPGYSLVGPDASGAALIILEHASLQQQKEFLPVLRKAADAGQVEPSRLAELEDKIRVGEGRKQIYGTLAVSDAQGNPVLAPVEDPQNLDARRRKVGLPPIDKQLKQMERETGRPIGRGNLATGNTSPTP